MKVLFLDVDGVLNRCGKSAQGLEEDKVLLLKSIVDQTDCEIVLSSTWRKTEYQLERIKSICLLRFGKPLFGSTPILDRKENGLWRATPRGDEIYQWIRKHPLPWNVNFVVLDDDADMGRMLPYFVKTESYIGLTPEIADHVIQRLNQPYAQRP